MAASGETLYEGTCASCHGPDAAGLPGLGKNLIGSDFVTAMSDAELVDFIKQGRPASLPAMRPASTCRRRVATRR